VTPPAARLQIKHFFGGNLHGTVTGVPDLGRITGFWKATRGRYEFRPKGLYSLGAPAFLA
jgi:hypothetical protein